jgi:hypothetical protein
VKQHLAQLGSSVAGIDPDEMASKLRRKVLTSRQPVLRGQIHRGLTLDRVSDESIVRRREGSICVLEMIDGELSVLLGDRELRMPARIAPAMADLATGESVAVGDLPGLDAAGRLVLVRRLIREGLLEVVG